MTPAERKAVVAGLDVLSNMASAVSPLAPGAAPFAEVAQAAIELAKGLVQAGHTDPAAELRRLRASIEVAWQDALNEKFRQG
jgi:hypothetical protein